MNSDQKFPQHETSTPAPTPPDLQPFPQLDHPYTDIGGKCHFCVCPEAEHSDEYSVQSLVTHVGQAPPLALILTRRTKRDGFIYDWYIIDSDGWELTRQPTEIDALRMAEMYALGFKRGSFQARNEGLRERHYLKGHTHTIEAPDAQQLRPRPGA
jgi:hypothetical protein